MSIPYDEIMARRLTGIYESHYLKANSPDGRKALWIKHTLLRPQQGAAVAELWFIWFVRGQPPRVVRHDIPWGDLQLGEGVHIQAGAVSLEPGRAEGRLGGLGWRLQLSGGLPALLHLPLRRLYALRFPKKKILTPVPMLHFDGEVMVDGVAHPIRHWVGLRGHNWGWEHAHTYAYGNCQVWHDGVPRVVDGYTARISSLLLRGPQGARDFNSFRYWLGHGQFTPTSWDLHYPNTRMTMACEASELAGLRYRYPDGREGYCYNTKFARVRLDLHGQVSTSKQGEFESFFQHPLPDVPLHPAAEWTPTDGPYDSGLLPGRS